MCSRCGRFDGFEASFPRLFRDCFFALDAAVHSGYVIGWPSFRLVLGCMRSKGGFRTLVIIGESFASAVYRSNSIEDT